MASQASQDRSSTPAGYGRRAANSPAAAPLLSIEVWRDPRAVLPVWEELEAVAAISVYQTRAFLLPWLATLGAARNIAPLFVVAKDRQARALALLAFRIEKSGIFRVARFLGGKESNINLGLFRPGVVFGRADIETLLRQSVKSLGAEAPDVFALVNQPREWRGTRNPFALLSHQQSPSSAYAMTLGAKTQAVLATVLRDPQKKLHSKELRLARLGRVALIANDTPKLALLILNAFFAQKTARLRAQGIEANLAEPAMRAFLEKLTLAPPGQSPFLKFYALTAGDRIVATSAGALYRGCFSGMVNSFDIDPEIARQSPGELLLRKLIVDQCEAKLDMLDFGVGKAQYKSHYCDVSVPLFDTLLPVGDKGRIFAFYESTRLRLKAAIKANRILFENFRRLQRLLQGQPPG